MPREVFVAGQVLTAAELNVVSDQSVMVFAGTAARGSAIPSPSEGMVTYRSDDDLVEVYNGSSFVGVGGKILQVVSTTQTTVFGATSATYVDITGMAATITPVSTNSKVLVFVDVNIGSQSASLTTIQLVRDATAIALGDAAGSRTRATLGRYYGSDVVDAHFGAHSMMFLDSPATTSATTYKLQGRTQTGAFYINRTHTDTDSSPFPRAISTITLMEVAG